MNSRHRSIPVLATAICIAFLALSPNLFAQAGKPSKSGGLFILKIAAGADYFATTTILLFIKVPLYPQIACWIETEDGYYIDTIYVTSKAAKRNFLFARAIGRPEALPVWYHVQRSKPSNIDAVTSATSASSSEHKSQSFDQLMPGRYFAMLEVNRSYDYNDQYTKANSGVNGQPSIIYRAEIEVGNTASTGEFVPIGVGSTNGSDSHIIPGLRGITTALRLIDKAEIKYVISQ